MGPPSYLGACRGSAQVVIDWGVRRDRARLRKSCSQPNQLSFSSPCVSSARCLAFGVVCCQFLQDPDEEIGKIDKPERSQCGSQVGSLAGWA